MTKLLYITANVKEIKDSYCLSVGEEFLQEYIKKHPKNEIIRVDLFKEDIPFLDKEYLDAMFNKAKFSDFDDEHVKGFADFQKNLNQFIEADCYIFALPLWNLGCPPVIKAYIDNICINGKTFHYTKNGPEGLLKNKKCLCIQSAGGVYSHGPSSSIEHSQSYIKAIMNFLGVIDFETVWIEGVDIQNADTITIKNKAILKVKTVANRF